MSGRQVDLLQERGISRVVFPIVLPALRERRSDISAPVRHFIKQFSHRTVKQAPSISLETMAAFRWYSWPGNIRELQNLVERAVILSRDGVLPNPLHKRRTEVMPRTQHRFSAFFTTLFNDRVVDLRFLP